MLCPASTSSVSYRPFPAIHKTHSHLRVPQFERAPSKEKGLGVAIALLGRFTAIHEPAPVIAHPCDPSTALTGRPLGRDPLPGERISVAGRALSRQA
jgi:hypothetical protein